MKSLIKNQMLGAALLLSAYRVLKPGGRLAISDIVATQELPGDVRNDLALHSGCMAGATPIHELRKFLSDAGFRIVKIEEKAGSREFIAEGPLAKALKIASHRPRLKQRSRCERWIGNSLDGCSLEASGLHPHAHARSFRG